MRRDKPFRIVAARMRFEEVRLVAADPEGLARFYRETLGLPAAGPAAVRVGATVLGFRQGRTAGAHHLAFNVPENQLREAKAWVRQRAPLIAQDGREDWDFSAWNADAFYFTDPEGNVLECIARHALPNASGAPFGPASLLEVSEVGLPVPDVSDAVEALKRALGVPEWRPPSRTFAPLGDEHGLLIVVPEGRAWFPTHRPAAASAVTLRVEGLAAPVHPLPGIAYEFLPGVSAAARP